MTLQHLISEKVQAQTSVTLEHLIGSDSLEGRLSSFLLAGRIEGLSPRTLVYYGEKLARFIRCCHQLHIEKPGQVQPEHIRYFLASLQGTNAPASIHSYFRAIRRFFRWMLLEGVIKINPMLPVRPPRVDEKVVVPYQDEQVRRMVSVCELTDRFTGVRNKAMILVFTDTGLRVSELLRCRLADLDVDGGCIKLQGKGGRERFVPLSRPTVRAVMSYLLRRDDTHPDLWVSDERKPFQGTRSIQSMIADVAQRAGVTGVRASPHTFRHTFATRSLDNGADLFQVQALLGHSTLKMTRKYAATRDSRQAVAAHHGTPGHKGFSPVENMGLR